MEINSQCVVWIEKHANIQPATIDDFETPNNDDNLGYNGRELISVRPISQCRFNHGQNGPLARAPEQQGAPGRTKEFFRGECIVSE